jgi:hypothetical protein
MNHSIEVSCYICLKVYTQTLYETSPALKTVIVTLALLLRLQYSDKYVDTLAYLRHLKLKNCDLKRCCLLSMSTERTPT